MHRHLTLSGLVLCSLISATAVHAQSGGGIYNDGGSLSPSAQADSQHDKWVIIQSAKATIQWAPGVESRNVKVRGRLRAPGKRSSGLPTGKRQHRPLTVIKRIDKATPLLARAAKTGTPLARVILIVPATQGAAAGKRVPYYKYELTNVRVTSYQTGGSSGDTVPMEQFSLNYEK